VTRTDGERLAVIEEIVKRTEKKLDAHIDRAEKRLIRLERFRWYATGLVTAIVTGLITYFKAHFPR
jgi:hypothetical protein